MMKCFRFDGSIGRRIQATCYAIGLLSLVTSVKSADTKKIPSTSAAQSAISLEEVLRSKEDLWGNEAMRQPNGPSYEFFKDLLPPVRYVSSDFRYYPLLLAAPNSRRKGRLISNGSGINIKGNTASWNEPGIPVRFRVGTQELLFGEYFQHVDGPQLEEGYLPIYQLKYEHGTGTFGEEVFASVTPELGSNAVALVRFSFAKGKDGMDKPGVISLCPETKDPLKDDNGRLLNDKGEVVIWYDEHWKWHAGRGGMLVANFKKDGTAIVAIATQPVNQTVASPLANGGYEKERTKCAAAWKNILRCGIGMEIPEPTVNNAWRSCVLQNFGLVNGNRIHYSAGNQYDKLYEGEGSDTATAFNQYGYEEDVRRFLLPLLDFTRKGLEYHQAGHKLEDICRFYWQTRDAEFVKSLRPRWEKELMRLMDNRTGTNGLYPKEQYCGDIPTNVFSLNSTANGWRAMRDTAAVLAEMGEKEQAERVFQTAAEFRKNILKAVELSERKDVQPPFVPLALYGQEEAYDFIPATKIGGYWNLMANYILGSHVFGIDSPLERNYMTYLQQHGGLVMGLTHGRSWPTWWEGPDNNNLVYGMRYGLTVLRKDEPERALVTFYGLLAQGMARDTFYSAESAS
ncbi:hypothetical protein, partial [Pedosphaera parvula]